mmetsp:Transcript_2739/g.8154  ORF Transcript_2739/g.8154 Transcript_2739/m.8154 type:complete len:176 (+) Transcript_2739:117-644(+)
MVSTKAAPLVAELKLESTWPAPAPVQQNFSGDWLLHKVDGPMEDLLKDGGASWTARRIMRLLGYGRGKITMNIQQDGDQFSVTQGLLGKRYLRMVFRAGAGEQVACKGRTFELLAEASWQGTFLRFTKTLVGRGRRQRQVSLVRLDGTELVLESTTSSGYLVAFRYVQCGIVAKK